MKNGILLFSASLLIIAFPACNPDIRKGENILMNTENSGKYWTLNHEKTSGDTLSLEDENDAMVSKFTARNFRFTVNMRTTGMAEGSIDFHTEAIDSVVTGYSVMIHNSDYRAGNPQKSGSLSRIRNNYIRMVPDDEWYAMTIEVRGNNIKVFVNNKIISEYTEPDNPMRIKGLEGMRLSGGKIRLIKTSEQGTISVGNMEFEAFDDDLQISPDSLFVNDSTGEMLTLLNQENFPVIDFHGHLKGGLTVEQVAEQGRINGYNYGLAPNCGLNFPVTNDSSLNAWYDEMKEEPVFKAMQCEGREWITLFTPAAIARYDYIFTDAMTWTDHKGRRMRLWIPEETFVDNEQQFMDMLVGKIEAELSAEPVDIFVNPTYLPEKIVNKYDELWTPERMDRVISVLVENDVALEINSRFRIPSLAFVKRARAAGVKFTLGTNNAGSDDLGRLEYSLKIIREAGITKDEMFLPRPANDKKVFTRGLPSKITG